MTSNPKTEAGASEGLEQMTPNQRRALSKALSALETMAALWASEIRLTDLSQRIADVPNVAERAKRIAAFVEQGFIEGAYRHYLDHKDQIEALANAAAQPPTPQADAAIAAGGAQEPIYQRKLSDGTWADTSLLGYENWLGPGHRRIVYASPLPREASTISGHVIHDLFLKWSEWTAELGEAISRKNIDGFVSELDRLLAASNGEKKC